MKQTKLLVILLLAIFSFAINGSKNAFANVMTESDMIINLKSSDQLLNSQLEKWLPLCGKLGKKFVSGKGFWKTGIAKKSLCSIDKNVEATLNKDKKDKKKQEKIKQTVAALKKFESKAKYVLDVTITGEIPSDRNDIKDKSLLDNFVGKPLEFWDGLKRQLFNEPLNDQRKITFDLKYKNGSKDLVNLSSRSYQYSDRFLGYFELEGFADLLAFDILVEAPFQWTTGAISKKKFTASLSNKELQTIEISNSLVNMELNKNLFFVRPILTKNRIFVPESRAFSVESKKDISLDIKNINITRQYIIFNDLDKAPTFKGVFLSLGHEPYTRYYAHKKFDYLLRKLDKLDLTFFFGGTKFGISQLLASNDELSYFGMKLANALNEEQVHLGRYLNLNLSINKGMAAGLKTELNYWPKSSETEDNIKTEIEAYNILVGYSYSFLMPILGIIDVTPTAGVWSYNASAYLDDTLVDTFNNSSAALGARFGYSINLFDFILSGYARYIKGFSSETDIFSSEYGGDLVYKFSNIYQMSSIDPAIYGFVLLSNLEINNSSSDKPIQGVNASGLVIGVGGSIVWE